MAVKDVQDLAEARAAADAEAARMADARFEQELSKWLSYYRLALGSAAMLLIAVLVPNPLWLLTVVGVYMLAAAAVLPVLHLVGPSQRGKLLVRIGILLADVLTVSVFTYVWGAPSPGLFLYVPIAVGWPLLPQRILGRLAVTLVVGAVGTLLWLERTGGAHEPPLSESSLGGQLLLFGVVASCMLAVHKLLSYAVTEAREHATLVSRLLAEKHAREREAEWAAQLEEAERLESLGRLAGGIAHDFNNLLTVLIGSAEFAEGRLPKDAAVPRRALRDIQSAAARGSGLTAQLLEFASRRVTEPRDLDLNRSVETTGQLVKRLLRDNITLRLELSSELCGVRLDPSSLERLLLNLCVNAADAMPEGGALTVSVKAEHELVALEVRDTGIGIEPADLPHVFEPFFTRKARGKGTGLGLSSVYGIVRQSQGEIEVESAPGQGACFRIRWPRVTLLPSESAPPARTRRHAEGTVVLVDDDDAVRGVSEEHLRRAGYGVIALSSGDAALSVLAERGSEIDLLVTDVSMPGMSGLELAHAVRAQGSRIPVLLISGYADELERGSGREGLDANFLPKPFSGERLIAEVERLLQRESTVSGAECHGSDAPPVPPRSA